MRGDISKGLIISEDLVLPAEAVTQTFAILAKRGVGKTYTALVLVEELLKAHMRVVIADPVGVCWGLRVAADGKSPGLPIMIIGGEHGDISLDSTDGQSIADVIIDEDLSAVLDLSLMRKGEQVRFMTGFAERLYHRNRKPLHLVLDEADAFAPQRPVKGQERMLGAVEDLVRRGRARGLGITLVTQRSAVLNKDVLTQVEVLIALRTIAPQDRNAIDDWVRIHGSVAERDEIQKSLPSLPVGTAWFWSPGWLEVLKRVRVRPRETFDSSATPVVGAVHHEPRHLATVDIARIRAKVRHAQNELQTEDPRDLRRHIAKLEQQLRSIKPKEVVKVTQVSVLNEEDITRLESATMAMAEVGARLIDAAHTISTALKAAATNNSSYHSNGNYTSQITDPELLRDGKGPLLLAAPQPKITRRGNKSASRNGRKPQDSEKLSGGERKILTVLAQYPTGRTKRQVALLTGYSSRGGAFNNYLSALRTKGMIVRDGEHLRMTDEGFSTGTYMPLPTGAALTEHWMAQLGRAERAILQVLINAYPDPLSKEEIALRTGYEVRGGGFNNAVSHLRTLELIEGRGELHPALELISES